MDTETANNLTDILTNASELQSNLIAMPDAGDSMERLSAIRKTALGMLNSETPLMDSMQSAHRQEVLELMERLYTMIALNVGIPVPDSTMFRIGAAADNLAREVRQYADIRNHAAKGRLVEEKQSLEN